MLSLDKLVSPNLKNQLMAPETESDQTLLCARCVSILHPGRGEYFEVQIRAVADPSPPVLDELAERGLEELRDEYKSLLEQSSDISETEAREQVIRQLTIFLCRSCYEKWIENPASGSVE